MNTRSLHQNSARNLPQSAIPTTAAITIRPKRNRVAWHVAIQSGKTDIALYGDLSAHRARALDRAELSALLAALNWCRHLSADTRCSIFVSPIVYGLLFGSTDSPDFSELVFEIRTAHIALHSHTTITLNVNPLTLSPKSARVLPFPQAPRIAPPQKPAPDGGLRSVA